jgi:hypothetical protein
MEFKVSRSCIYLYFFWNVMRTLLLLLLFYFFEGEDLVVVGQIWNRCIRDGRLVAHSRQSGQIPIRLVLSQFTKDMKDKNKQIDRAQVAVHPQPRWIFARPAIHLAYITKDTCCVCDRSINCRPILFYLISSQEKEEGETWFRVIPSENASRSSLCLSMLG